MLVLAKFDVRRGHEIVWCSDESQRSAIAGVEYEMLPSGLHDRKRDTIYFSFDNYEGVAAYRSQVSGADLHDRSQHYIYSLAALGPSLPWAHTSALHAALERFFESRDLATLPESLGKLGLGSARDSPVFAAPDFVQHYGPRLWCLWKLALSRRRLLLRSNRSISTMSRFVWLVSKIGKIPLDVQHLIPQEHRDRVEFKSFYNVTVRDLEKLKATDSFCATTTDDILLYPSMHAFSVSFIGNREAYAENDDVGANPTWRDQVRFKQLASALQLVPSGEITGSRTSNFIASCVDQAGRAMRWWAAAGDLALLEDAMPADVTDLAPIPGEPPGASLVGAFYNCTRRLFKIMAARAADSDGAIEIGVDDIYAMGLDPLAHSDRTFLERLALTWWDRPVRFLGLSCCCCCV